LIHVIENAMLIVFYTAIIIAQRLGAHRDDNQRFIVRADERMTAFVELEAAIRCCRELA